MHVLSGSGTLYKLNESEITHFFTNNRVIQVYDKQNEYFVPTTFDQSGIQVAYPEFIKVHDSAYANLNLIKRYDIDKTRLIFTESGQGNVCPVGPKYERSLLDILQSDRSLVLSDDLIRVGFVKESIIININEIAFFIIYRREITAFTMYKTYSYPVNLTDFYNLYASVGFMRSDRSFLIRKEKVQGYSKERKGVYFTKSLQPESFIAVAAKPLKYKEIIDYLKKKKD